jgi:hypothetical protein
MFSVQKSVKSTDFQIFEIGKPFFRMHLAETEQDELDLTDRMVPRGYIPP